MLIIILVLNKPYISRLNPTWSGYVTNLVHCKSQFSNILLLTLCLCSLQAVCVCFQKFLFPDMLCWTHKMA